MPKPSNGPEFLAHRSKMKAARKVKRDRLAATAKEADAFRIMVTDGLVLAQRAATAAGAAFGTVLGYINQMPLFTVEGSHLHEGAKSVIGSAIRMLTVAPDAQAPVIAQTVDMGRTVGKTHLVEVKGDERFFEATRGGKRKWKSRFVEGRESEDTSKVTMVFAKQPNGSFMLYTAYVGDVAPRELPDLEFAVANCKPELKEELTKNLETAKAFWAKHAFTRDALND